MPYKLQRSDILIFKRQLTFFLAFSVHCNLSNLDYSIFSNSFYFESLIHAMHLGKFVRRMSLLKVSHNAWPR